MWSRQAASRVPSFCLATTTIGTFIPLAPLSLHSKRAQPATCRARRRRKLGRELVGCGGCSELHLPQTAHLRTRSSSSARNPPPTPEHVRVMQENRLRGECGAWRV